MVKCYCLSRNLSKSSLTLYKIQWQVLWTHKYLRDHEVGISGFEEIREQMALTASIFSDLDRLKPSFYKVKDLL